MSSENDPASTPAGAHTLARGLRALQLISNAPAGLTIQELAERLEIHRTVAGRLLSTLEQFHLVARRRGRFHAAAGLAVLGASFDRSLRELSLPILRELARTSQATASLLVAEGDEQVAIAVVPPPEVNFRLSFREGSRYPINLGAGGMALQAGRPPRPGERDLVAEVRKQGWVMTHGEAEPNVHALAVPVKRSASQPPICVTLVSHRPGLLEGARPKLIAAADELAALLDG